ncbi:N-6 DNA methylase, partial [bacterium]|nr:N-6 DNA methylase [bacterium]
MTPAIITELCDRFERDEKRYKQDSYNEAQLRQDFLNPLLKELGWDVYHEQRATLSHREVRVEVPIKMGNEHGFLDYAFCVDGRVKFVVEAKKPWVSVETYVEAAKQVRRYGWNQKLGLSILTNFREFAIYDCTAKPGAKDSSKDYRLKYFGYQDLRQEETWKWLSDRFSRSSVLGGFLDEFAAKKSGKRGSAQVDETLLQEIDGWRTELAGNIYKRNEGIDVEDLNYIVGKIIDRIIFLRVCEDRGIEPYETLLNLVQKGGAYPRLVEYFYKADERYNSGLFHFKDDPKRGEHPDLTTPLLKVDDVVLQGIIRGLYYPKSQFLFSEIPIEILGHVYEQFLGKVIALKGAGKRKAVEVDFNPEVRKAGGVYYTPTYIVDYIVKHTVGKLVEGKTPEEVSKLRVLDPACGSGSFLIGAYQFLLDWHLSYYSPLASAGGPGGVPKNLPIHDTSTGLKLTLEERKRILLNNIYGVDIDAQAVEVTKLSLLLKVLEGATEAEIKEELAHKHHALPDLGKNIKCGNSLVGTDILTPPDPPAKARGDMTSEEIARINPFDWKTEFKSVFKQGGFDAVIGNPPYLFITELAPAQKKYFQAVFSGADYRFDAYALFIEGSCENLLSTGGHLSFIVPHTLLSNDSYGRLRALLAETIHISLIVDIGPNVFAGAKNETMVFLFVKESVDRSTVTRIVHTTADKFPDPIKQMEIKQHTLASHGVWHIRSTKREKTLIDKLSRIRVTLGDFCSVNQGLRTGNNEQFLSNRMQGKRWKPAAGGKEVARYKQIKSGLFVHYDPVLLDAPRKERLFTSEEKIVIQEIRNITLPRRLVATLDIQKTYCLQSTNVINHLPDVVRQFSMRFFLGLLNSELLNFWFRQKFSGNNHIASNQVASIPIPSADKSR